MTASPAGASTRVPWGRETLAGLSGAIGSVPDGMATAVLAGANPMTGLYASFAGPMVGGLLQSTAVMVIATTSAAAVTTQQVIQEGAGDPTRTLATLTVLAGAFMVLFTLLGFARLMRFVSASVMAGFMFGVGLVLILGQLADATGVTASGGSVAAKAVDTVRQAGSFQWPSMLTAATAIAVSVLLGRGRLSGLAPLVGIAVPALVIALTAAPVATVQSTSGPIAVGLPPLALPDPALISPTLVTTAVALAVVVLVQAAGVGAAYPDPRGRPVDVSRDFLAQGGANVAAGLVGGIPVGGSVGQTAFNVMAGGTTRWAVVISGAWMLVFVVALGPVLSDVPIPALAGLLILAGWQSLKPHELVLAWRASLASGVAAVVTMLATLVLPVHVAVLIGVLLSLLLVGITSAGAVHLNALEPAGPGRWRRVDIPPDVPPGSVVAIDVEGSGAFSSVARMVDRLPLPAETGEHGQRSVVVLRMRGHVRTNLTFARAVTAYAGHLERGGARLVICGLLPDGLERLRSLDLPPTVRTVGQGEELDGSLAEAVGWARHWVDSGIEHDTDEE